MEDFRTLAARIAAMVSADARILEVAPGPGFLSIELAKRGFQVRAVDISKTFVEIGQKNAADMGVEVDFVQGNAAALPVADSSVDLVVCRAAFKNFTEPVKAMREMLRVVRPGGTALLIDLRRDVSMAEIQRYVREMGLSWLSCVFTIFTFKHMLIKRAYPLDEIQRMAKEAGWTDARIEVAPLGFEASVKK